jgi:hypothetical protein
LINKSKSFRNLSLFFLGSAAAIFAQNAVTISPSTVFLNGTFNGGVASAQVAVTSSPGSVGISVAPPGAPWLTVTQATPTTPTNLTFTANAAGLAVGVYSTAVSIITPSGTVPEEVIFTVNTPSPLTPSPTSLTFNFTQGGSQPVAQNISVSSSSPGSFTVSGTAKWLLLSTATGQTAPGAPGTVTAGVDPTALSGPGIYAAAVTITPTNGLPSILVPVAFYYVGSPQLTSSALALSFNYQIAAANNTLQKSFTLTNVGPPLNFTVSASVPSGQQWLSVTPTQGATPATINVSLNPAGLPAGQYQGSISVSAPNASNTSMTIPVTLNVGTLPLLDLSTTNLTFAYQVGGTLPPDQFVTPTTTTPGLN